MCGRFALALTVGFGERFGVDDTGLSLSPRYNITPSQQVPIVYTTHAGERVVRPMMWGLVPSWTRDTTGARPIVNARADTLTERPSFRGPLTRHRCLVPATGFYEWGKSGTQKVPYYIRRRDEAAFAFAGLFDVLRGRDPSLWTFTIITTDPNALVARIHDRMPAILRPEDEARWIAPGLIDEGEQKEILSPFPQDLLEAYPVSRAINDPLQEGPHLVRRTGDRTLDF